MFSLNVFGDFMLSPSSIASSTYMFYWSSITVWAWPSSYRSKWCFMVSSSTNGDSKCPKIRHINGNTTESSISRSLIHWNLIASRSSLLILICRKDCFKSSVITTGFKRHRVSTFQIVFCNAGPFSKLSFKDKLAFAGFAYASYMIQSLVLSAGCFTAGLYWM